MSPKKFVISLGLLTVFFVQDAQSIRLSAVRDGAEEVLYGSNRISSSLIEKQLRKIDQPETNPFLKVENRDTNKALSIIQDIRANLEEITKKNSSGSCNSETELRIRDFLSLDLSQYDSVSLSFLMEEICAQCK